MLPPARARDDDEQTEPIDHVGVEGRERGFAGLDLGEHPQRRRDDIGSAQVDTSGGDESRGEAGPHGAVHQAGRCGDAVFEVGVAGVGAGGRVEDHRALVEALHRVFLHHQLVAARGCSPVDAAWLVTGCVFT